MFLGVYLERKEVVLQDNIKPYKETIIACMKENGIIFPEIVYTQAVLETHFFTSAIYKENKNMFGMKYNKRGYALTVNRGHALYSSTLNSIKDYAAWQKIMVKSHETYFNKTIKTKEDYFFFLENIVINKQVYRYAEDLRYIQKINNLLNE